MGWTTVNTHYKDVKTFIRRQFEDTNTIIHAISVKGNVAYVLETRSLKGSTQNITTVTVVLISKKGGYYSYKDISEFMGPFYFDCPVKFLLKLTPLDSLPESFRKDAESWRKACFERFSQRKKINQLQNGQYVYTTTPLHLNASMPRQIFKVVTFTNAKNKQKQYLQGTLPNFENFHYRLSTLNDYSFDVFSNYDQACVFKKEHMNKYLADNHLKAKVQNGSS